MTRNLYLGADISTVFDATNESEFFEAAKEILVQAAENRFPRRALAIAREAAIARPDVIGLRRLLISS